MKRFLRAFSSFILIVTILAILGGLSYYYVITKDLSLSETNLGYKETSVDIYDTNNRLITKSEYVDTYVDINDIPEHLKNAFISIEDKRFYKHKGIDIIRIFGALINNIRHHDLREGASTISQQLIKNTHLSAEKSISRKIQEASLARKLERSYSKDDILEMYLNEIYLGNGIYGVANASERFFDKSVNSLTLSESAMLAGIVKNPAKYSPVLNYANSLKRRNLVIKLMHEQEMISSNDLEKAQTENISIKFRPIVNSEIRPYINNAIRQASNILGISTDKLRSENYRIYTYLDYNTQMNLSNRIYNSDYYKANENGVLPDGIGLIVDNMTSGISAYSSTTPYTAYDVLRQPGSAIKPLAVYTPALEYNIISPLTQILDEQTSFADYSPKNYNDKYHGWVSAREALAKSMNIPAVKVMTYLGTRKALNYMDKFRFNTNNEDSSLSLALGGTHNGASVIQMAAAYRALADNGWYRDISFIREIEDDKGRVLYRHNDYEDKIVSDENAYLITDMLMSVVSEGTAAKLNVLPYQIASKTGTVAGGNSDYNTDAWSLSYTTEHTLCVWQGNVSNKKERMLDRTVTGGNYPTMIARDVFRDLYYNSYPDNFMIPDGIVSLDIDRISLEKDHLLLLADENTPDEYKVTELFSLNNRPKEVSDRFSLPKVEDFSVNVEDNRPIISFIANKYVKYHIVREIGFRSEIIGLIKDSEGIVRYIDETAPENDIIKYSIYPTIEIENAELEGMPSETITILINYQQGRLNNIFSKDISKTLDRFHQRVRRMP